jgi:HPt (histidine-containing phosphotransfer) domain-containing protein
MVTHANPKSNARADRTEVPLVDRDVLDSLASVIGRDKVDQFLTDFIEHAGKQRVVMREALAYKDFSSLYRSAHMLLSVSGSLGATKVSRLCDRLQRAADAHDTATAAKVFRDVDQAIEMTLRTMTAIAERKAAAS